MRKTGIYQEKQKLDDLFDKVKQTRALAEDQELLAHWSRYLCILVSGFLENALKELYGTYAQNKAQPRVANFVKARLETFRNPNMERVLQLANSFSPEWREALERAAGSKVKDAVDSIAGNRNSIAHGRSVGLTYSRMYDYYKTALKLVDFITEQCNG